MPKCIKRCGIEKEVAKFRVGLGPTETKAKIVQWTIFPTRLDAFHLKPPKRHSKAVPKCIKRCGIEKEVAKFRAGLGPAETKVKIVRWTIFPTRLDAFHLKPPKRHSKAVPKCIKRCGIEKEVAKFRAGLGPAETKVKIVRWTIFPTRLDVFHLKPPKRVFVELYISIECF